MRDACLDAFIKNLMLPVNISYTSYFSMPDLGFGRA